MTAKETQEPKLSFIVEITTAKPIVQQLKFKTRTSATNLEDAFLDAIAKAKKMQEADPTAQYTVTDVHLRE